MAFDAGMIAAITHELNNTIINAKIEKIHQPEKDEIIFYMRNERTDYKLLLSAGANNPRLNLTGETYENPKAPPMFCMLLRKHLINARITSVCQLGFERAVEIAFDTRDELGFDCTRYIYVEIMGKHSNIIFCNQDKKVISAIKIIDFTTSQKRQILPGMLYEAPPPQNKKSPLDENMSGFLELYDVSPYQLEPDKFITANYMGISQLVAREIAYRAGKMYTPRELWNSFNEVIGNVRNNIYSPVLVKDTSGKFIEYCFTQITQYGSIATAEIVDSFGGLIDLYFTVREKSDRIKQRAADIFKLISNTEARLLKKIQLQKNDIKTCAEKDIHKLYGELILSNIYKMEKGITKISLPNYYDENLAEVEIGLDSRLTPSQNAQVYFKRYNKAKVAEVALAKQIQISEIELDYIYTVFESLTKAENENDLNEIRQELYESGYASKMRNYSVQKMKQSKPLEFTTDGGYKVLCGKNNIQNDILTFKTAAKLDYWFHTKNIPGSHVVMFSDGEEPSEVDFTQAAIIAAQYSKASDGENVAVDYTLVKNIKKPVGSKPGFVTYSTNWTAYVTPDAETVKKLKGTRF